MTFMKALILTSVLGLSSTAFAAYSDGKGSTTHNGKACNQQVDIPTPSHSQRKVNNGRVQTAKVRKLKSEKNTN